MHVNSFSGSYWNIEGKRTDTAEGCFVYDVKWGDVYGDHRTDTVFLMGKEAENITLVIQDCRTGMYAGVPLSCGPGCDPRLFLGDFNKDGIMEILVQVNSADRIVPGKFYIFSYKCTMLRRLFDSEKFNEENIFQAAYLDGYKVDVCDSRSNRILRLDISNKSSQYLSHLYNEESMLIRPAYGQVRDLSRLYPIIAGEAGNAFGLLALRPITGVHTADILGYAQALLVWNGKEFAVQKTGISIGDL